MPIDPSIPLGVRGPQPFDAVGSLSNIIQLRGLQQRQQFQEQEMALKQREVSEKDQVRAILQETQGNLETALPKIRALNPLIAASIEKTMTEAQEAKLKLSSGRIKHDLDAAEFISRQLNGVTDQESYDYAKAAIAGAGLPTDQMQPVFSPGYIETLKAKGISVKEQLDLKQQENDRLFQERKFQAEEAARQRDDTRADSQFDETRRHNRVVEARTPADPLVAIVGKDGKPVLVPRSQAVGQTPAAGAGGSGGGRGVTSGDAGRIAEINSALDELKSVKAAIGTVKGSTGTKAAIGAALPNWVTEVTGRGATAKQKQAIIDRSKQIIGKGLEGGVLRKEDEKKYTKILVTISDPDPVVETKLNGMEQALIDKRERTLEALEDAGYDTTRYRARTPTAAPSPTAAPAGGVERWERGPDGKMRKVKG